MQDFHSRRSKLKLSLIELVEEDQKGGLTLVNFVVEVLSRPEPDFEMVRLATMAVASSFVQLEPKLGNQVESWFQIQEGPICQLAVVYHAPEKLRSKPRRNLLQFSNALRITLQIVPEAEGSTGKPGASNTLQLALYYCSGVERVANNPFVQSVSTANSPKAFCKKRLKILATLRCST